MSRHEEKLVLRAIAQLGDGAYGAAIYEKVLETTAKDLPFAAIYIALDHLEAFGLITTRTGEATQERGWRKKRYAELTEAGREEARRLETKVSDLIKDYVTWTKPPDAVQPHDAFHLLYMCAAGISDRLLDAIHHNPSLLDDDNMTELIGMMGSFSSFTGSATQLLRTISRENPDVWAVWLDAFNPDKPEENPDKNPDKPEEKRTR